METGNFSKALEITFLHLFSVWVFLETQKIIPRTLKGTSYYRHVITDTHTNTSTKNL